MLIWICSLQQATSALYISYRLYGHLNLWLPPPIHNGYILLPIGDTCDHRVCTAWSARLPDIRYHVQVRVMYPLTRLRLRCAPWPRTVPARWPLANLNVCLSPQGHYGQTENWEKQTAVGSVRCIPHLRVWIVSRNAGSITQDYADVGPCGPVVQISKRYSVLWLTSKWFGGLYSEQQFK